MDGQVPAQAEHGTFSQNTEKRPHLSRNDQKWESFRQDIHRIYMTENNTLPKTMLMIEKQHNFKASPRKWKSKLKEWGYEKHLTEVEMKIVVAKAEKRKREEGKDTLFKHNGLIIPSTKLENFKRRKTVRESDPASPSAQTPVTVSYSTPRPEYDSSSMVDCMEEISEQVQGLEVSQFLGLDSSTIPPSTNFSKYVPCLEPSENINCSRSDINGDPPDPVAGDKDPSRGAHGDQQAKPNEPLEVSASVIRRIQTCTVLDTVLDKNNIHSSHIGFGFLEAVEILAQLKQQEGGDNILVYQQLSKLAEVKRLENRPDLDVALCSFIVMGYKKFLGPTDLGTPMAFVRLADALMHLGRANEADHFYNQAIEGYRNVIAPSCRDVCNARGTHIRGTPGATAELCDFEECPFHRNGPAPKCLLVKYLAIELGEGETPGTNEIVDQCSRLDMLCKASPGCVLTRGQSRQIRRILSLSRDKRKCEDKEAFLCKLARKAMALAMQYTSSPKIVDMLFLPVLARFEAPGPLHPRWDSWKGYFYGVYALRFDKGHLQPGRHLIKAIYEIIKRDGISGLSDTLGQELSAKLFSYRKELEEELEFMSDDSEKEPTLDLDLAALAMDALSQMRPQEQISKRPKIPEGGNNQRIENDDEPRAVVNFTKKSSADEAKDMLVKIRELEDFVATNVSPDMACVICFGNCVCQSEQAPDGNRVFLPLY